MSIKKLSKESISSLCNQQVIVDLQICKKKKKKNTPKKKKKPGVKELLENSLDANSTIIEIQLKDQGKDGFTIKDNGDGISFENLEKIA